MRTARIILASVLAVALMASSPSAQSANQLFQQALSKEQAEGKLEDAIVLYERVVKTAGSDRTLTARALLQIGRCYEKLGQQGAKKSYERLIQEFGDQKDLAAQARARLAALARGTSASMAMRTRPLTDIDALQQQTWRDFQGLSPDASKALIGDYSKGQNFEIFDVATKKLKFLTNLDWSTHWVCCGRWSPRNEAVAYEQVPWNWDLPVEVHVTSLDGQSRMIFRHAEAPGQDVMVFGWLPDGSKVLVLQGRSNGTAVIGTIPANGGPFTPIRQTVKSDDWGNALALSPDGHLVAFSESDGGGARDIRIVTIDGSREYRVTDHPGEDSKPLWSADGRQLAFISNRSGSDALWTVAMRGAEPVGAPFKIKDGMQNVILHNWNAQGIVYRQDTQMFDVFTSDKPAAGGDWAAIRPLPYPRSGRNSGAVWSPDGSRLAFIEGAASEGARRYVVVQPADGGRAAEFLIPAAKFPDGQVDLRWFGNGQGLGFPATDAKGNPAIFRLTLPGGEWQVLPLDLKTWTRMEWNDDGSAFFYVRQKYGAPPHGIRERDIKTGVDRELFVPPDGPIRLLKFSRNRKWLAVAVQSSDGQNMTVMILDRATGEQRTLATVRGNTSVTRLVGLSSWAPDDNAVALLVSDRTTGKPEYRMRLAPIDDSPSVPLEVPLPGRAGSAPPQIHRFDWSSDGRHLAFVVRRVTSEAFIIENPLADAPAAARAVRR